MHCRFAIMLLICVALLAAGAAHAQGRGPDVQELRVEAQARAAIDAQRALDPAARAAKQAELEAFLRQLVGRFRYDGELKLNWGTTYSEIPEQGCSGGYCKLTKAAQGLADCVGIGDGPGVQCVTHIPWPRFQWPSLVTEIDGVSGDMKWWGPYLDGAMTLYGIDPDKLGIRFLLVDGQSIAFTELGVLKDRTLTFETVCVPPSGKRLAGDCLKKFQIRTLADGRIEMTYDLSWGPGHIAEYRFSLQRESTPTEESDSQPPELRR
jgi:hypothetical protein